MELYERERRKALVQTQPAAKRFKTDDVRSGGQRGHTYGKCGKVHDSSCQSSFGCHKCGKEGHYAMDCC